MLKKEWAGFTPGVWGREINVRDFIQKNYTPYDGDDAFLAGPTQNTRDLWDQVMDLSRQKKGAGDVLDMGTKIISIIISHGPGCLNKEKETIVGFQTNRPFERSLQPYGGIRIAEKARPDSGYTVGPEVSEFFTVYRKAHNVGVFDAYTPEVRACRSSHVIIGLPGAYGRGRIIGDYRRIALCRIDRLIEDEEEQKATTRTIMYSDVIHDREKLSEQVRALKDLKKLGEIYDYDIFEPANGVREVIQWTCLGYPTAVEEQNGAAVSLGRTSIFIDTYAERNLAAGTYTEGQIQGFVDRFIMKLHLVKPAKTPEYNELFSGGPTWVTESTGGVGTNRRHTMTKTSYRYLHTLKNLGTAPELNLTVFWSTRLPQNFKRFCAKTSIESSSIQYGNDNLIRVTHGDDYVITCCVSSMRLGREMQFFGARVNLVECLLYTISGGVDEVPKKQVKPKYRPITSGYLGCDEVMDAYRDMTRWLARMYVNTLNIIHCMHDKYCYERVQMALHNKKITRWFTTDIAGLSVVADSLPVIRYTKVKTIRDENGIVVGYEMEGDFPKYGNNDDRIDQIANDLMYTSMNCIKGSHAYRGGIPITSILAITFSTVYGKATDSTLSGRRAGEPFAPGVNPMHRRNSHGAVASLASVAKLPFKDAQSDIFDTFSIIPGAFGKEDQIFVGDLGVELNLGSDN